MRPFARTCLLLLMMATTGAGTPSGTVVNDSAALQRLYTNSGVTLHYISFETPGRGQLDVRLANGFVHLKGMHRAIGEPGLLTIEGDVLAIDARSFTFRGRIVIADTPDPGRRCIRDGVFHFRQTGVRRYWRMQEMERCDGLTDYVDIFL
ncbi:hypothetical protein ACFSGX_06675 [Sphingomonas arantia]|uniref:Uncharacterized protein n=1 Tax=Sphingomonas arantia TaxID=1460676 RepID=A0ABW4TYG4_9SPHN